MAVVAMRLVLKPTGADEVTAEDKQIVLDLNVDEATNVSTGPFPAWAVLRPDTATSARPRRSFPSP